MIKVSPANIFAVVADAYALTPADIPADGRDSRSPLYSRPRFVAAWLLRKLNKASQPETARLLDYRHHSSVIHAERKITGAAATDAVFAEHLADLQRRCLDREAA